MFHVETYRSLHAFSIVDEEVGIVVDVIRSERAAGSHVRLLNAGHAHVDRYAPLGCRVVPAPTRA